VSSIDFAKADFVTLAFGQNDWFYGAELGSMQDDIETSDAMVPDEIGEYISKYIK
jgi:hypothetical protein